MEKHFAHAQGPSFLAWDSRATAAGLCSPNVETLETFSSFCWVVVALEKKEWVAIADKPSFPE